MPIQFYYGVTPRKLILARLLTEDTGGGFHLHRSQIHGEVLTQTFSRCLRVTNHYQSLPLETNVVRVLST